MHRVVLTAAAVAALAAPAAAGASAGQSANGGGNVGNVTFSFNARGFGTGDDATGQMHEVSHGPGGGVVQADVVCMHVEGNAADIQGTVTRSTTSINPGDTVFYEVRDNGEPGRDDQFASFVSPVFAPSCGTPFPDTTIDHGNIQVRP
jgi:hypothetical protein